MAKGLVALFAVIVLLVLGVMAAFAAKGATTHAAATQNPVATQAEAGGGNQPVDSYGSGHGFIP
jgi:hypothetical protein